MRSFCRHIVVFAVAVASGCALIASTAQCEEVSELLGQIFSMSIVDKNTAQSHTVTVRIGSAVKESMVDYKLTIDPPLPEEYKAPSKLVGKGVIEQMYPQHGDGPKNQLVFRNHAPYRPGDFEKGRGYLSPDGFDLQLEIGGGQKGEFAASGEFGLTSHSTNGGKQFSIYRKHLWEK